jgi:hypothetical protein
VPPQNDTSPSKHCCRHVANGLRKDNVDRETNESGRFVFAGKLALPLLSSSSAKPSSQSSLNPEDTANSEEASLSLRQLKTKHVEYVMWSRVWIRNAWTSSTA